MKPSTRDHRNAVKSVAWLFTAFAIGFLYFDAPDKAFISAAVGFVYIIARWDSKP